MEVAAAAATGGSKAVKEGGPHRHQSVLGKHLGTWPVGHAVQGKRRQNCFSVVFRYRGSVVVSYTTVSEP
jgi:hypothetical protein